MLNGHFLYTFVGFYKLLNYVSVSIYIILSIKSHCECVFSGCKSSIPREISNKQWPTCVQYSMSRQEIVFSEECKNDGCNKIHCLCKAGTLFFINFGSPKIISLLGIIVCNINKETYIVNIYRYAIGML